MPAMAPPEIPLFFSAAADVEALALALVLSLADVGEDGVAVMVRSAVTVDASACVVDSEDEDSVDSLLLSEVELLELDVGSEEVVVSTLELDSLLELTVDDCSLDDELLLLLLLLLELLLLELLLLALDEPAALDTLAPFTV